MTSIINLIKNIFQVWNNFSNKPIVVSDNDNPPVVTPLPPKPEVMDIQKTSPLPPTPPLSKLTAWCEAAKAMEGAKPELNNPGNIRYVPGTWMAKLAIGKKNGFCIFRDYDTGYSVLHQFFVYACTGKSRIYHPADTLYEFYSKYAPSSDGNDPKHYAEFVAGRIGVSPGIEIRQLL